MAPPPEHRPQAVICLPTYNERENIEPMVEALGEVLDVGRDRVLVIDDASPDGTGDIADRLARDLPWLSVLHRPRKEGIGPAYVAGFRWALAEGAELVVEMDCDFSHDPHDVPRLIAASEEADLVLGSRYVAGGGTENWGLLRRMVSRGGCLYAQVLLGVAVRDLTGGFKCFRREALEAIDLATLSAHGYAFQIETTYRVVRAGLRVREVPIRFVERRAGASKMSGAIVLEAIWRVPLLRLRALRGRL
ncbi:MAG: polyprenol monophosphomannose synthase [Thermoleophilia bacterium]|nr:polyprenol monophosphomannose synthase [Gaiellaceae bacterium]MDW8338561.1 polyprenol monophosphomannose synthase [Thermoleophilia bacterium]